MALELTTPIIKDGIIYPNYALKTLVLTGIIKTSLIGNINQEIYDAHAVLSVVPYRNKSDGTIEELTEAIVTKSYAFVFEYIDGGDIPLATASQYIYGGIDTIVKGQNFFEAWQ